MDPLRSTMTLAPGRLYRRTNFPNRGMISASLITCHVSGTSVSYSLHTNHGGVLDSISFIPCGSCCTNALSGHFCQYLPIIKLTSCCSTVLVVRKAQCIGRPCKFTMCVFGISHNFHVLLSYALLNLHAHLANAWLPVRGAPNVYTWRSLKPNLDWMSYAASVARAPPSECPARMSSHELDGHMEYPENAFY